MGVVSSLQSRLAGVAGVPSNRPFRSDRARRAGHFPLTCAWLSLSIVPVRFGHLRNLPQTTNRQRIVSNVIVLSLGFAVSLRVFVPLWLIQSIVERHPLAAGPADYFLM
jgi:hypothetical protein